MVATACLKLAPARRFRMPPLAAPPPGRCRYDPVLPAFSPSVTCAPVRSSVSAPASAKEPRWWPSCTSIWLAHGPPLQGSFIRTVRPCPHALGLAVPLVIVISTTMVAQSGLLVHDRQGPEGARICGHRRWPERSDRNRRKTGGRQARPWSATVSTTRRRW